MTYSYQHSPASRGLFKALCLVLFTALFLLPSLPAQTGTIQGNRVIARNPGDSDDKTDILRGQMSSRALTLDAQSGNEPFFILTPSVPSPNFFQLRNDQGDVMVQGGWFSGASDFGTLEVKSTLDPADATTIEGAGLTARTIVLRNLAGFSAAIHIEETGGGTDTVQLRGPASTTGVSFYLPGTDGSTGQCLSTNGSGVLSWAGCSGGTGSSAGAIGDVQFSADGAGTFGADAAMNWDNTNKRLKLGASPGTTQRLNLDGNISLNNNNFLGVRDSGGTVRAILASNSGQVEVGNTVAPASGGDLFLSSRTASAFVITQLEARSDNVGVFRPLWPADGTSTDRMFLGDNDRPWEAFIGLQTTLISGLGSSPAQFLIEERGGTFGSGEFVTILGQNSSSSPVSYSIGLPANEPQVGDALMVAGQDGSIWDLEWAPGGGGGSGCTPTGAEGQVLWYTGSADCSSDSNLFWNNTDKRLGVGTATPQVRFQVNGFGNGTGDANIMRVQYGGSIGDGGKISFSNSGSNDVGRFGIRTSSGSTADFEWHTSNSANAAMLLTYVGELELNNDRGLWFKDTSAAYKRTIHFDGSNNLNVGLSNQTVSSGGDLVLWAAGTVSSAQISTILNWTGSNAGSFTPNSGDTIALGTSSLPWATAAITQQLVIDTDFIPAHISLEDENASGRYFVFYGPPGTMASSYNVRMPASTPSVGNVLSVASLSGGAYNLQWTSGAGTGCASDPLCVTTNTAQTITGQKTLAANVLFNADNTYSVGQATGNWATTMFSSTLRAFNLEVAPTSSKTSVWRFTAPTTSSFRLYSGTGGQIEMQVLVTSSSDTQVGFRGYLVPLDTSGNNGDLGKPGLPWENLYLSGSASITSGLTTGSSSNSTFYVGSSGNFYNRTLGGASTAVSCAGVTSGWTAISTDNYVVVCRSGTRYRAALTAF